MLVLKRELVTAPEPVPAVASDTIPDTLKRRYRHWNPSRLRQCLRAARSPHGRAIVSLIETVDLALDRLDDLQSLGQRMPAALYDNDWSTAQEIYAAELPGLYWVLREVQTMLGSCFESSLGTRLAIELHDEGAL